VVERLPSKHKALGSVLSSKKKKKKKKKKKQKNKKTKKQPPKKLYTSSPKKGLYGRKTNNKNQNTSLKHKQLR